MERRHLAIRKQQSESTIRINNQNQQSEFNVTGWRKPPRFVCHCHPERSEGPMHFKRPGRSSARCQNDSRRSRCPHLLSGAKLRNASNLTQWHSASPGPRLCSESPPNHGASSDDSGPTTDHSNVCSASGLDFALVVCQDARHTEQEEESYAAFSTPDCLLA